MKTLKRIFVILFAIANCPSFAQTYVLDPSFDGDGIMTGAPQTGASQLLFHNNKYYIISDNKLAVVNYNGTVDTAFGTNGYLTYAAPQFGSLQITGGKIAGDGLLVYGVITDPAISSTDDIFISRINLSTGQIDNSFGNSGINIIDLGVDEIPTDVLVKSDGTIFVTATKSFDADFEVILAQLTGNGQLDTGFEASGYRTLHTIAYSGQLISIGNEILLTGTTHPVMDLQWSCLLMKVDSDGNLIESFGDSGIRTFEIPLGSAYTTMPQMAAIKGDNLYFCYRPDLQNCRIAKYAIDTDNVIFDKEIANIGRFSIADDDQIYYTEYTSIPSYNFTLKRLDNDGHPDTGFNDSGQYIYTFQNFPPIETMALIPYAHENGRVLVSGWSRYPTGNYSLAMIRIGDANTLGVASDDNTSYAVYPNPVENTLKLKYPNHFEIEKIEVFDLTGKKLVSSAKQSEINVTDLTSGIYTLAVTTSGATQQLKFLKR